MEKSKEQIDVFRWVTRPTSLSLNVGVEDTVELLGYLVHPLLPGEYLRFPSLYGDFVINMKTFMTRVGDDTSEPELRQDFQSGTIKCPLWTMGGDIVSGQHLTGSRMFRSLTQAIKMGERGLENYKRKWITCFDCAVETANYQTSNHGHAAFSVLSRYFHPSVHDEFRLCIMPGYLPSYAAVSQKMLQAVIDAVGMAHTQSVTPIVISAMSDEDAIEAGYVKLSTNPLGLYSTWLEQKDRNNLGRIVDAMAGGTDTWCRPLPTKEVAWTLNEQMGKFAKYHFSTFAPTDELSLIQFPGDQLFHYPRLNTKDIMEDSANKWAISTLKWGGQEKVRAEWLHIIGHRFWPGRNDTFRNLIFGTKECNTAMMRAEAAVTQLLQSEKVYAVELVATPKYNIKYVKMLDNSASDRVRPGAQEFDVSWMAPGQKVVKMDEHPHWLTAELDYKINTLIPNKDAGYSTHEASNVFHPFSRQRPFRFEYELDKALLGAYLRTIKTPTMAQATSIREQVIKAVEKIS